MLLHVSSAAPTARTVVRTAPTADLSPAELRRLRAFLDAAFGGNFDDVHWSHALGGVHVLATVDGELAGHASVVGRHMIAGEQTLRTGYVEAVGTGEAHRRRGIASAVMATAERLVTGGFELGALAASEDGARLYLRRGWLPWRGPLAGLTPTGIVDTPDEQVFVLPTPATTGELDPDGRLVCDWRPGELW
jgi:aminoglycoside 2'-N-acetyltransferase I